MRKHKAITYKIYNYISNNCKGEENAITMTNMAAIMYPNSSKSTGQRNTRALLEIIAKSDVFENVFISTDKGYFMATKNDIKRIAQREMNTAISLFLKAKAKIKKADADGQIKIPLTENEWEVVRSLCEVRNEQATY